MAERVGDEPLRVRHLAKLAQDDVDGQVVDLPPAARAAILGHGHAVAAVDGVARRALDGEPGRHAGQDQRVGARANGGAARLPPGLLRAKGGEPHIAALRAVRFAVAAVYAHPRTYQARAVRRKGPAGDPSRRHVSRRSASRLPASRVA